MGLSLKLLENFTYYASQTQNQQPLVTAIAQMRGRPVFQCITKIGNENPAFKIKAVCKIRKINQRERNIRSYN
jgi:hypothetical protein